MYTSDLCPQTFRDCSSPARRTLSYLVEEVDLGDGVAVVPRVLHQQRYQAHKGVQGVETLGAHQSGRVRLLAEGAVAQVDAHLRAQAEEASDEVVRL